MNGRRFAKALQPREGGTLPQAPFRVMIAEDKPTFRRAMGELIRGEEALELVGAAADAQEAIDLADRLRPDVALLDVKMPAGGGPRATREIRRCSPDTRIIALSAYEDRGIVLEMLQAGAVGYLVKGTPAQEILAAIHRAGDGKGTLSAEVTTDVIDELSSQLEQQDRKTEAARRRYDRIRGVIEGPGPAVAFQPIVDLDTLEMVGIEALARFSPEFHGPPNVWFAVAAAVGLQEQLEIAAVSSALEHIGELDEGVWMSVNVSPTTAASPRFLEAVEPVAGTLVLEITEHAPVHDYEGLNEALQEFRSAGGRLAVDDAGAGFSSLRHILRLAPDFIKLDGALTRDIDSDRTRRALGAALISFSAEIGRPIIAEAVESQEELETLRALGATFGQGFFLGPPGPLPVPATRDDRT